MPKTCNTAGLAALWDTVDGNAALEQGAQSYLGLAGDPGWALDAGVSFRPSDRWSLEASVAGVGRMAWQRETWSATWETEAMTFDGLAFGAWAHGWGWLPIPDTCCWHQGV